MIQYILEVIAFQLVFLIIYDFWLKRETFFQWNRAYLIGAYMLSMALPWIKIEAFKTTVPEQYYAYPEFLWTVNGAAFQGVAPKEGGGLSISWEYLLLFGGMFMASLFFANKLRQLYQLKKNGKIRRFPDFTQIIIINSQVAFSFFKSIFMGDKVFEGDYKNVIAHELVHIKQRHTYDLLFFELLRIVCWFNPLVYVYQSRVSELHEFIADAQVAKTNKEEHYQLLLSRVFETQNISFINQFFKSSLIKKRIIMLRKTRSKRIWQLKYLLLVPMVLGMLAYTSAEQEGNIPAPTSSTQNDSDVQLIAEMQEQLEKDIQALMAKKGDLIKKDMLGTQNARQNALFYLHQGFISKTNSSAIFSKKDYFINEIVTKMVYDDFSRRITEREGKSNDSIRTYPLPSTERYESYVSRKEAFFILDPNLQFSVKAYEQQVATVEISTFYPVSSFVFEVDNVKDLTGIELRAFNNKLAEIFEQRKTQYKDLILTDTNYAFRIFTGIPQAGQEVLANSDFKGYVQRSGNTVTLNVRDAKALTKGEKSQEALLSKEVRESKKMDTLIVTDGKFSKQLVRNSNGIHYKLGQLQTDPVPFAIVDEIPIFPGCEDAENKRACFQASLQLHISKYFKYPKDAEEQGMQGRVSIMFTIDEEGAISNIRKRGPHKLLEDEAVRIISLLPQMKAGKHKGKVVKVPFSIPISFKLTSSKFVPLKNTDPNATSGDLLKIENYNKLVRERNSLLKNAKVDSRVIVDLDDQLVALRANLEESKITQNEDDALYSLLRQEREEQEAETVPFATVHQVPVFPGCEAAEDTRACFREAMHQHINAHFNYPKEAQKKGIQGRVSLLFVIGKDGVIRDIRKKGPDKLLEDEAVRIISKLPNMKPGKNSKGEPVNVPFSIPITFKL